MRGWDIPVDVLETIAVGVLTGLAMAWLAFALLVWVVSRRKRLQVSVAARILPDTVRLLGALVRDRDSPRAIRWRLGFAAVYCGQPFNLIPDFIPVIGYLDNIVVAAWAMRSVVRLAGLDAVREHWRGSPESLSLLCQVLRIAAPPEAMAVTSESGSARKPQPAAGSGT